ncbi:MAG: hypothetical protein AB8H80_00090 [Planctomycetota bacterium]
MLAVALLGTLFGSVPQSQEGDLATRFVNAEIVASVVGSGLSALAPDGSRLATVDRKNQTAHVIDAATGEVTVAPHAGLTHAIALPSAGRGCWLGLADGTLVRVLADGSEREFECCEDAIDGVVAVAGYVGWSSSKGEIGGLRDARSGEELWRRELAYGNYRRPRLHLSRDGRHALCTAPSARHGGRRERIVLDAATGKQVASLESYMQNRKFGPALDLDGLVSAEREGSFSWRLLRLDLVSMKTVVVDSKARGRHFVDLLASSRIPAVLEGDHEEKDTVVYDFRADAKQPKRSFAGKLPLGFAEAHDGSELVLTTTRTKGLGIIAWRFDDGTAVAEDVPFAKGKPMKRAGSVLGGSRIWMVYHRRGADGSSETVLELVRL